MEFIDRQKEIEHLKDIERRSAVTSQFTVVSGRRRIGKTALVLKAYEDIPLLYFFVTRKAEAELCPAYMQIISDTLGIPVMGTVTKFSDVFEYVMRLATDRHLTVVIDEFQDFFRVNPSVFSDMQRIWDKYKDSSHINLIVCGSVSTLLNKVFRDRKEPLFGRQTDMMALGSFSPSVLIEILGKHKPGYSPEDLLALYLLTGGVAKYVEMFVDRGCLDMHSMMSEVFTPDSFFLSEGKAVLIEEFGKDYGMYFSILSLVAQGHNARNELEDILRAKNLSGYLNRLIEDYGLLRKRQPLFEKTANKNVRYAIGDKFLSFWFRYIYKYDYIIEAGAIRKLQEIVEQDYTTYSGRILEDLFRDMLKESGEYTRIGYWHDRSGNNEIDIIAADDLSKTVKFFEVKRQRKEIDLNALRAKADVFLHAAKTGYMRYDKQYIGLSLEDMA